MSCLQFKTDGLVEFDDPFNVRQYAEVFSGDVYEELCNDFPLPDESWLAQGGMDRKFGLSSSDSRFFDFVHRSEIWTRFVRETLSLDFALEVGRLIYPSLKRYKEKSKIPPRLPQDFSERLDDEGRFLELIDRSMTLGLQFSRLHAGQFNSPHSDTVSKIATILLYFPDHGWKPEYGGGTHFFRMRGDGIPGWFDPNMNRVPGEHLEQFWKDTETFFVSDYVPNTACMFCKSVDSFHAVGRIRAPENLSRRAVVMTLRYRKEGDGDSWDELALKV